MTDTSRAAVLLMAEDAEREAGAGLHSDCALLCRCALSEHSHDACDCVAAESVRQLAAMLRALLTEREALREAVCRLLRENGGPTGGDSYYGEPDTHVLVRLEDFRALEKLEPHP